METCLVSGTFSFVQKSRFSLEQVMFLMDLRSDGGLVTMWLMSYIYPNIFQFPD
jgi:hypothetical protein